MKIQQCRLLFKAATSNANGNLKEVGQAWKCFRPCGWIAVTLAALLFGCSSLTTSLTPDRVQVLSQIAGQAAQYGVGEWLKKHPQHQSSFEAIYVALSGLVKATNYNEDAWVELLSSLPVNALEGPNGALYVSEGLVVWDAHLKKGVAVRQEATPAVLKATYRGLRNAVWIPKPPAPVVARARKPEDLEGRTPEAGTPVLGVPTNVPAPGRATNNAVASTFDVTLNEHGIQQVNVRWIMDLSASYTIQRMDENKDWEAFASATNTNAVATTCLWRTLWHHQCPVGNWRVVRR